MAIDGICSIAAVPVELADHFCFGITDQNLAVARRPSVGRFFQTLLIFVTKATGLVVGKAPVIGRIAIDEIVRTRRDHTFEITYLDLGNLQRLAGGAQTWFIAIVRVPVISLRDIELALFIDPIEAVVTGFVQIDETCRDIQIFAWFLLAHLNVISRLVVLFSVDAKPENQSINIGFHDVKRDDQFLVGIGEDGAIHPVMEGKECCATTKRRFPVA